MDFNHAEWFWPRRIKYAFFMDDTICGFDSFGNVVVSSFYQYVQTYGQGKNLVLALQRWLNMEIKVIHALSLTGAFVIAAMGLNSKWKGLTAMYSLHSWLGFGFVLIFGIQVSLK